jgi:hypothetical protein
VLSFRKGSILKKSTFFFMVLFFSIFFSKANALRLVEDHEQTQSNFHFQVFCPATEDDFKPFSDAADTRRYRL